MTYHRSIAHATRQYVEDAVGDCAGSVLADPSSTEGASDYVKQLRRDGCPDMQGAMADWLYNAIGAELAVDRMGDLMSDAGLSRRDAAQWNACLDQLADVAPFWATQLREYRR